MKDVKIFSLSPSKKPRPSLFARRREENAMDAERASPLRVFRVKKQNIKHLLYLEFCSLFFRVPFRLRPRLAVNRESIVERSLSNGRDAFGDRYGGEAEAEGERLPSNGRDAFGDRHGGEARAGAERSLSNGRDAVGNRIFGEALACRDLNKCFSVGSEQDTILALKMRIASGDTDLGQFRAKGKWTAGNACHAVGNRYGREAFAASERSLSNGRDAFGNRIFGEALACRDLNKCFSVGSEQDTILAFKMRIASGDTDLGQFRAKGKWTAGNACHTVGYRYRGEVLAATERLHSNGRDAVRDGDGGGCAGIFCDGDGTVVDFVFKFSVVEPFF